MSKASKGRHCSDETKAKIGLANKGKKRSKEVKKKMSEERKGKRRGFAALGIPHSKETKRKISLATKGREKSEQTKKRLGESRKGAKHPLWKGGRFKSHGYIYIRKPEHPFADKGGRVFEHRLMIEKHLSRYLEPQEVVHHINGIFDDNRIENLKLFPNNKAHMNFHYNNRVIVLLQPN